MYHRRLVEEISLMAGLESLKQILNSPKEKLEKLYGRDVRGLERQMTNKASLEEQEDSLARLFGNSSFGVNDDRREREYYDDMRPTSRNTSTFRDRSPVRKALKLILF